MSVGKRLKIIRKQLGLSQARFAEELSIHLRSYVSYEHEHRTLPQEVLSKIREMGYSLDWLISGEGNMKSFGLTNDVSHPRYIAPRQIPLLDNVEQIGNLPEKEDALEFILWPMLEGDPHAYAIKVKTINDTSMLPLFSAEEIVIASPLNTVLNNDKSIVKLKDGRIFFRVIQFKEYDIELLSANPSHPTITLPANELVFAHKVIGSLKV